MSFVTACIGALALAVAVPGAPTAFEAGPGGLAPSVIVTAGAGADADSDDPGTDPTGSAGPAAPAASSGIALSVTIPSGALSLTTRTEQVTLPPSFYGVATTRVTVADTRAGDNGFAVSLELAADGGSVALVTGLHAVQVPGNALQADDVRVAGTSLAIAGRPVSVASYRPGLGLGSVVLEASIVSLVPVHVVWTVL